MPTIYTEASYENSVIELFENMGYTLIAGYPYIGAVADRYATCVVGTNTTFGVLSGSGKGLYVSNGKNCHAAAWIISRISHEAPLKSQRSRGC